MAGNITVSFVAGGQRHSTIVFRFKYHARTEHRKVVRAPMGIWFVIAVHFRSRRLVLINGDDVERRRCPYTGSMK